jgi:hypothetical protein
LAEKVNDAVAVVTVPLGPAVIVVSGALRSIFTVTERCVVRPAPSVAEHVSVVPAVSAVSFVTPQPLEESTSDTESDTNQLTDTSPVYQPFAPGVPVIDGVASGGLESYLNVAVSGVVSPAPFVQEPLTAADFVSGPPYATGAVHFDIPDTASVPEKAMVRGCVYQPFWAGFDVGSPVTAGPVVSTFTTMLACALRPSVFEALHVSVVPVVSEPIVVVPHPEEVAIPDSGSVTTHATVTALVYQPSAPAVPDT